MSGTLPVGVAVRDITPPPGLPMAGFVARPGPATGTHDPLTVRAIAVGDTALAVVDVVALSPETSRRIRSRAGLPDRNIVVTCLHTHGGPVSTPEGLGDGADPVWLAAMEDACVAALDEAVARQRPATLAYAEAPDPGIARNRRHPERAAGTSLQVLVATGEDGTPIAHLVTYACHPVVLGADNRLWTADFPGVMRRLVEERHPGTVALFATGCCGDLNTGHTAHGSITTASNPLRTFAEAERIGHVLADALAGLSPAPLPDVVAVANDAIVAMPLARNEPTSAAALAARWEAERPIAPPGRAALLESWTAWANGLALLPPAPMPARVAVLRWGGLTVATLPGEIFSATGADLRRAIEASRLGPAMVLAYADECRGYIPPVAEYPFGGYEVAEAHRYYGARAAYAPGGAERLADAALQLARQLVHRA
ncbi:alkaline ceramidase [uncultured Alsobacter sp.]|uniref:alkaline ceramidase n=1 Tax=uncultured Alsobacter sp. TaxID=1748258 RepID=UPI0025FBAC45|nr:alkaline ceramidase [uncultured Alsobacter sp.]